MCVRTPLSHQFYISPKENATPIRVLHNTALHLHGAARPLGAVMVGYQGVRAFNPSPVPRLLHCLVDSHPGGFARGGGGVRVGLALLAMARQLETLYAATKATCTLIKTSGAATEEMKTTRGYQVGV